MDSIISMSIWGDNPRYIKGAIKQIELAKKWYPGFKIRLYVDDIKKFNKLPKNVELIKADTSTYGMFWRFEPLFENDNNLVLVRDTDSRITQREFMAVKEWIDSDKTFHTFRDHEAHFEFPIIGCAFAMKGKLDSSIHNIMKEYSLKLQYYCSDQYFLRDVVYPKVKDSMMIHSMNDGWFGETRKKLINPFSFCGNGYDENDMPLYPPTLEECKFFDPKATDPRFKFDGGFLSE